MHPAEVQRVIQSSPSFQHMVHGLMKLVYEPNQAQDLRKIVKLQLSKSALDCMKAPSDSCGNQTKDALGTTVAAPPVNAATPLKLPQENKIDESNLETLDSLTIHAVWAMYAKKWDPNAYTQPPGWVVHLDCKGYKTIASILEVGMERSTEVLRKAIFEHLRKHPKYFDLNGSTKGDIFSIRWDHVEKCILSLNLRSLSNTALNLRHEHRIMGTATATKDLGDPMRDTIKALNQEITPPSQPLETKKRKHADMDPDVHSSLRSNSRTTESPYQIETPLPDTQRRKLRQGNVRNIRYSAEPALESYSTDGDTSDLETATEDECEEDEDDDETSDEDDMEDDYYQESEDVISEDGNVSSSEVTDDCVSDDDNGDEECGDGEDGGEEEGEEVDESEEGEEDVALPEVQRTPSNCSSFLKEEPGIVTKPTKETTKTATEDGTTNPERGEETTTLHELKEDDMGSIPNLKEVKLEQSSTPQVLDPIPDSLGEVMASPQTPAPGNRNNIPSDLFTPALHSSTNSFDSPTSTDRGRVYFSPGFKAEEILSEFKLLRTLTKYNYDRSKGVERRLESLTRDRDQKDERVDRMIEEIGEVREGIGEVREEMKKVTNLVEMLFSFCKGENL
ncbi:hypothetical protein TWF730_002035 [Orbilia blumenaviensis]|uniref:Uncharacterized protein n=1 Tax=Orbilia blumenaviensis TaxID=1796055 RepID=A0AAV9UGU0_9PEZI